MSIIYYHTGGKNSDVCAISISHALINIKNYIIEDHSLLLGYGAATLRHRFPAFL
jgi:hypothetical protein